MGWGKALEDSFDVIVFLYVDTAVRLQRLQVRERARCGRVDPAFLAWAAQYDTGPPEGRSLAKHNTWLASQPGRVVRLNGNATVVQNLSEVLQQLPPDLLRAV